MPNYSIFVLDESDVTLSAPTGLDGVTQGDGSHLLGTTLVINAANWTEILVTDSDDSNFQDSDSSQTLNGTQTIDGVSYAGGTMVEAEYGFTVTDGTNSWQLIGFNVNNSSPAYGTVEGIAVIGGPGGFPPAGVTLTVTGTQEGPNYAATDYATPICFAAETRVRTSSGWRSIGTVGPGDTIKLRNGRMEPVLWVGQRQGLAQGTYAPVRFEENALGTHPAFEVSQQHRILVTGWRAELLFGEAEVLVPAVALVNDQSIRCRTGGPITYVHVLFGAHELIDINGVYCESLMPGPMALASISDKAREEIQTLLPKSADPFQKDVFPLCSPLLSRRDAQILSQP